MLRKFKVTFIVLRKSKEVVIEATSKYDAKKRFYRINPNSEIIKIEEVEE